jgi:hypothetical protein
MSKRPREIYRIKESDVRKLTKNRHRGLKDSTQIRRRIISFKLDN